MSGRRGWVVTAAMLSLVLAGACGGTQDRSTVDTSEAEVVRVEPYGGQGAVRVTVTPEPRVVAYVSMERMEVYVDRDFRDRASWLLDAHISVSTWHWRIPLPGDDPGVPITPGDEAREFEELDIALWDRSVPSADDIRIVLADTVSRRITVACVAVEGEEEALSAELPVPVSKPSDGGTIREDFHLLGTGLLHADTTCAQSGERPVPVFGWGPRPPA